MDTEARLLDEACRIARGRSGVTPSVHHLIVLDMAMQRLQEANNILLGMLEERGVEPDTREMIDGMTKAAN